MATKHRSFLFLHHKGYCDCHCMVFIPNSTKIGKLITFTLTKIYLQVTIGGRQMKVLDVFIGTILFTTAQT